MVYIEYYFIIFAFKKKNQFNNIIISWKIQKI